MFVAIVFRIHDRQMSNHTADLEQAAYYLETTSGHDGASSMTPATLRHRMGQTCGEVRGMYLEGLP